MSIAPRPHTQPSMISPPKGSSDHLAAFTGTTSVWPRRQSVGASGSEPSMRAIKFDATRRGVEPLDVEARAREVGVEQVDVADLVTRCGRAVVDALVPDEQLHELDDLARRRTRSHQHLLSAPGTASTAVTPRERQPRGE